MVLYHKKIINFYIFLNYNKKLKNRLIHIILNKISFYHMQIDIKYMIFRN